MSHNQEVQPVAIFRSMQQQARQRMITLAKTLSLHVVGEGIETAEQLSFLQALGCVMDKGSWSPNLYRPRR